MILESETAELFIGEYKRILLLLSDSDDRDGELLKALVRGRDRLARNKHLLPEALATFHAQDEPIDAEVAESIETLQVADWIYLRDTRQHSIFMDTDGQRAYGVIGLTDRIRDITGSSGAIIKTGLLVYKKRIVCDGLISGAVWLGRDYRRSYNERLSTLRATWAFSDRSLTRD